GSSGLAGAGGGVLRECGDALYLTAPATREIRPVGFGVMSMTDLVERIAALAQDAPASARQP
ncbi:MAG: hypothetical protein IH604_09015, partial [Burkholderiales bacterium]|nr:hypothetical protein [Burkholderiales bacterium]